LKSEPNFLAIVAAFIIAPAWAQTPSEVVDSNQDFELAGADVAGLDGDGGLELSDVNFVGNPSKDWFNNWPEDLVIAPIPGRSPQMGWKLTLAGGYFLESPGEDSDASPSVLGGFPIFTCWMTIFESRSVEASRMCAIDFTGLVTTILIWA